MQFTKKRKILVLCGLFALLAVTGYLNFALNNQTPDVGGKAQGTTHLITMFRNTRAEERAMKIATLQGIADTNSSYTAEARSEAEAQLFELFANMEFETATESLILAHFSDAVVSRTNDKVNVLIKNAENITRAEAAQIFGILCSVDSKLDVDDVFVTIVE